MSTRTLEPRTAGTVPEAEPSPSAPGARWPVALVLAGVVALIAARPLRDNSFLTHLATGRLLLEDGLPAENPFLFTGTAFPVPSWWWSLLLAGVEELGGAGAIRLLTAALTGALAVVLVRLTRPALAPSGSTRPGDDGVSAGDGMMATVLPAVLALSCTFQFLNSRPHLLGYLLLALVLLVWWEERSPWWLLPALVVWVNVHGSWVYGVGILAVLGAARAIDDRRIRRRDLAGVGAAVAGVVAGGALYPERFELVLLPTRQFGDTVEREALQLYKEWGPVGLDRPVLWALVALTVVSVLGCVRRRRWATAVVAAGLCVMALSSMRFVPVAAVSLVAFAAEGIRGFGTLQLPTGGRARALGALGAALLLAAGVSANIGPHYDLHWYPVDSVDRLEARGLVATDDVHLVSHDYVGNYLEWRFGDDANAYVDDRPDAATFIDYVELRRLGDGWRDAFERADADVVLWERDEGLVGALASDPDWVLAWAQGDFAVLCRVELAERCR